ncbi:MAG TPA: PAC2 family protein [Chloroflexota bacterium]|nr:PAC2 family protein [Chloroflexota bacterium]
MQVIEQPVLRRPILLLAFSGWVDGGQVGTSAVRYLIDRWGAKKFAELDPDSFYNFTRVRPQVQIEPDFTRTITWPETAFYYHVAPVLERDFVLLLGIEPNYRWRTFSAEVQRVCEAVGVSSALSLGGVIAEVPHTRPAQIRVFSSDPDLIARFPELGARRGAYQGPTGIIGVISDGLTKAGIPVGNMRGAVPHYIAGSANPKVTHGLLARLNTLYDLGLDLSDLAQASRRFERQVNRALADRPEAADYVKKLEGRAGEAEPEGEPPVAQEEASSGSEELPSGDEIIRQFEEFLRERSSGQEGDASDPHAT